MPYVHPKYRSKEIQHRISSMVISGNREGALELAREAVKELPDDIMIALLYAEMLFLNHEDESVLDALQTARLINPRHPMYFRMVFLASLRAKAFKAAHGALHEALLHRLPWPILKDLRRMITEKALRDEKGQWPEEENTDPAWTRLLPPIWTSLKKPCSLKLV